MIVDLGDDLGSKRWWRGFATLSAMIATLGWIAFHPAPLPTYPQAPLAGMQLETLETVSFAALGDGAHTGFRMAPTARVTPLTETPERPRIEVLAKLREIDSFSAAMRRAGVGLSDVQRAGLLVSEHTDIAKLRPGTAFDLVLGRRTDKTAPRPLERLSFRAAFDLRLDIVRSENGELAANRVQIHIDETPLRISGVVGDSIYQSARAAGLSSRVVANYIRALSPRVNFNREVYASNEFDVIVEHKRAETGETETGDILYARLDGRRNVEIMRWEKDGRAHYFLPDGHSVKAGLTLTPVSGARLTSGYGMRRHPILKRSRLHKGIDFAARSGTPIQATADGKVIFAGRNGGYGKQVRIRHANGIVTSYSHMRGFAKGIRRGTRVAQGERIGYVGSTGLSTGPHLHYEVHVGGRAVNPKSQRLPTGVRLTGAELRRFQAELERMRNLAPTALDDEVTRDI